MFRSRFRGILAVVLMVCGVWTATPTQAQSSSKFAMAHPGAIYLSSFQPADDPAIEAALVVDAGSDGSKAIEALKKLLALIPKDGPEGAIEEKIGDATFMRPKEYPRNMPHVRIG